MRKYRDAYIDMGPSPGPDLPHGWQGRSAQELLGDTRQQHATPDAVEEVGHDAAN